MTTGRRKIATSWKEGRRLRAFMLARQGWTNTLIAEALGVSEPAVSKWLKTAECGGTAALRTVSRVGQGRRLQTAQLARLQTLLDEGAEAYGFRGEVWTCPRIADVIAREFGVRYHPDHVRRLLHRQDWTYQKPILQSDRRDNAAIAEWLHVTWPSLQTQAKTQRRTIVFVDEAGFYLTPTVSKTWGRAGQTPTVHGERHGGHLSAIGGLTWEGSLYIQVHKDTVRRPETIGFLKHLRCHVAGRLLVLWDRAKIHWNDDVDAFLAEDAHGRIRVEPFPAYAPEVDPQEYVWHQLKHVDFRNLSSHSLDQVWVRLRQATQRLRQRVGLLRHLIKHAGLES